MSMDTLYARDPRDALLMTCFNMRQGSLSDLNELLVRNGFEALRSSGKQEEGGVFGQAGTPEGKRI